jgi:hypothetical protein
MFVVAARSVKHFWLRDRSRFFAVEAATAASGARSKLLMSSCCKESITAELADAAPPRVILQITLLWSMAPNHAFAKELESSNLV